jgi:hypothetical protein
MYAVLHEQPAIAKPAPLVREFAQPCPHAGICGTLRSILECCSIDIDQPAGTSLGLAVIHDHLLHRSKPRRRPSQFFLSRSFSTALSHR